MKLTTGYSFGRPVLYLSTDSSADVPAALEGAVYAPGLQDVPTGTDASGFSAVEVLYLFLWYIGPMHHVAELDYTGVTTPRSSMLWIVYTAATVLLFIAAWVGRSRQVRS